jgi:hypothetical protein
MLLTFSDTTYTNRNNPDYEMENRNGKFVLVCVDPLEVMVHNTAEFILN